MSEWKEYNLDEIYQFSSGLSKAADQFGFGYPFLSFKEVFQNYFLPRQLTQLVNSTENERKSGSIKRGDVFITRTSETDDDLGMTSVALRDYPDATFNGFTKRMRPNGTVEILPEFAGYYFRAERFQAEIAGMSSVTTRASLNNGMLAALKMRLPPLAEQKAIAEVLSSLDDKIDLLHRQNKTLESLAETLFRHWFIEQADNGWKKTNIGSVLRTELGGTPSTTRPEYWDGDIPWINSGAINKFRIIEASRYISDSGLQNSNCKLLPRGTTVLAITGATLGQVSLLEIETTANQSVVGIIPNETFPKEFVFLWVKHKIGEMILNETGGAQPHINKNDVNETEILFPPSGSDGKLEMLSECFDKITMNVFQVRTLTRSRDALLPKLMSGEINLS